MPAEATVPEARTFSAARALRSWAASAFRFAWNDAVAPSSSAGIDVAAFRSLTVISRVTSADAAAMAESRAWCELTSDRHAQARSAAYAARMMLTTTRAI